MSDIIRDIKEAMETEIQTELGVSYKSLAYVEDVTKNSFRTSSERFGVRALEASQVPGVTKYFTMTQAFEVVLLKGYIESALDDSEQVTKAFDNRENLLAIYKRLVNNKCGIPSAVMNVFNLTISEPEYLVEDKVAVQRATMDITYRINLI
jgi:cobalamin-dependent methionine synthase I